MPYLKQVKYFNTFWTKNQAVPKLDTSTKDVFSSVWPGSPWQTAERGYIKWVVGASYVVGQPFSNCYSSPNVYDSELGSNWIIEEGRIRGGYNNTFLDKAPRAFLKENENRVRYRKSSLIYSGVFNSRTGVNENNVFNSAEDITKTVDPHNGSVQKIFALDNNLTICQENKVSQALIDKDAIYSAEGSPLNTTSNVVIGQVTPYVGDYGISRNPESFASFGFRRYFADKDRNAVMRLSRDGLTPISQYGMTDWFRDNLAKVSDSPTLYESSEFQFTQTPAYGSTPTTLSPLEPYIQLANPGGDPVFGQDIEIGATLSHQTDGVWYDTTTYVTGLEYDSGDGVTYVYLSEGQIGIGPDEADYVKFRTYKKDVIQGGYDTYKSNYVLSLKRYSGSKTSDEISDPNSIDKVGYYSTLAFDETPKGWTTFYTFRPIQIFSVKNIFYSTRDNQLYSHYTNSVTNEFYGTQNKSSIKFIFNGNPSINKNFKTINYEGSSGWQVDSIFTDIEGPLNNSSGLSFYNDESSVIKSLEEGSYTVNGMTHYAGFTVKENKYYAVILNNSNPRGGEVVYGNSMTGVKGYYAEVAMSTDNTTSVGGTKELFSVGSEIVISSK
jgi:hypothetical protein